MFEILRNIPRRGFDHFCDLKLCRLAINLEERFASVVFAKSGVLGVWDFKLYAILCQFIEHGAHWLRSASFP